jgi:hypothetical protein
MGGGGCLQLRGQEQKGSQAWENGIAGIHAAKDSRNEGT